MAPICRFILFVILLSPALLTAQTLKFERVRDEVLKSRVSLSENGNTKRLEALSKLFEEAGCTGDKLARQPVKGLKIPNIICTLPGTSAETVIVGAHFDSVTTGKGFVDNWSGASLLPSIYEALSKSPRKLTFLFVGFTEEETGLKGSRFFVRQWKQDQKAPPAAMINIDSVGLNPPKIETSRSDKRLAAILARVGQAMKMTITGVDVSKVGTTDASPFAEAKVPVLDIHSVTQDTFQILHSPFDDDKAVQFQHYKDTYLVVTAFLTFLDQVQAQATQATSSNGGN